MKRAFVIAIGWAVMAYGLRGLWHHRVDTRPANLARFYVGGALVHDLLVAPLVTVLGVLLVRAVPAWCRAVVQGALIVSAILVLFSWPLVRGYAHVLHNPTSLPRNYTASLLVALACVWFFAGLVLVTRFLRRTRAVT